MERDENVNLIKSWLKDLSAVLGVELVVDDQGICTFQVGEDIIAIEAAYDFPMVYIFSSLLALPFEDKELAISIMSKALEINALQMVTRGGAIALAPGGGFLIYCFSMPIEGADSEKFSSVLGAFFETLPDLKKQLKEFPSAVFKDQEKPSSKFPLQKV